MQAKIVTIIGKRGKGKTTLTKELIETSECDRILIFDYLGEYYNLKNDKITIARYDIYNFCKFAWETSNSDEFSTLVIFDEVQIYGSNNPHIDFLYQFGRHRRIYLIAIARRFYNLPVNIRGLTDEFHVFAITEERDINYLKAYIPKEGIQQIINLDNYQYITLSF